MAGHILVETPDGLYCEAGRFFVDPWRPVERAIVTHGHSDHARYGHRSYLCTAQSVPILSKRLGPKIEIEGIDYGERRRVGDATVSLHPAGHIFGSAQVRIEVNGQVACVTGDYKTEPDASSEPFELVKCHTFVTETTFGLPVFRWKPQSSVCTQITDWITDNQANHQCSLLLAYSLGKAQRLIRMLEGLSVQLLCHGSVFEMNQACRQGGLHLQQFDRVPLGKEKADLSQSVVIAPPSALGTSWTKRLGDFEVAFVSGWMAIRGIRRRRGLEKGFVLSDHVDWPALIDTVAATGCHRLLTTHGYAESVARYFAEQGIEARPLKRTPQRIEDAE